MIRVLIADDHALVRDGVRALLATADDVEVVAEAGDGREAVDRAREMDPDVVLLDIAMPGLGGLEAVPLIQREAPRARILILTQYEHADYVRRFLRLGVAGYVLKKAAGAELLSAIRAAHRGGLVLDPAIAREALKDAESGTEPSEDPYDSLTERERQVLKLVAEGRSNKEIASLLEISVKTAMTHREHVMQKLNLHNRTDVTMFAIRRGIIQEA
ncbi:MAG TPA: response regulator transcription factor [Vicinamibacterales bacterium]|nr:response regulator transcription factor [Vicinamibacterales bacterium]